MGLCSSKLLMANGSESPADVEIYPEGPMKKTTACFEIRGLKVKPTETIIIQKQTARIPAGQTEKIKINKFLSGRTLMVGCNEKTKRYCEKQGIIITYSGTLEYSKDLANPWIDENDKDHKRTTDSKIIEKKIEMEHQQKRKTISREKKKRDDDSKETYEVEKRKLNQSSNKKLSETENKYGVTIERRYQETPPPSEGFFGWFARKRV